MTDDVDVAELDEPSDADLPHSSSGHPLDPVDMQPLAVWVDGVPYSRRRYLALAAASGLTADEKRELTAAALAEVATKARATRSPRPRKAAARNPGKE